MPMSIQTTNAYCNALYQTLHADIDIDAVEWTADFDTWSPPKANERIIGEMPVDERFHH